MINLIINELTILLARKKYKIFFYILIAINILTLFLINNGMAFHSEKNFDFVNYIINISFANVLILCFSIILTSEIFGLEYTKGTIRNLLVTPIKRFNLLLAKFITIIIYAFIQYLTIFIFSIILNLLFEHTEFNLSYILNVFINRNLLALIFSIVICMFLVIYTKSISISSVVAIVMYFIGHILSYSIFNSIRKYYIYTYINVIIPSNEIVHAFILSIIYLLIFIGLIVYKFEKLKF